MENTIKMPTRDNLADLLGSVRAALAWGFMGVETIAVRTCVYAGGRSWTVTLSNNGRRSLVEDNDKAQGELSALELAKIELLPHVYAETKVSADDSDELIAALATSMLEDLNVQRERMLSGQLTTDAIRVFGDPEGS